MTMTTSGHIWSWPDYCKTNENVNIKLLDLLLLHFTQYMPMSPHALAINRPDILLMQDSDEKRLQNYSYLT